MKTSTALKMVGGKPPVRLKPPRHGAVALAKILGISRQAVHKLPDILPKHHEDTLRAALPERFKRRKGAPA